MTLFVKKLSLGLSIDPPNGGNAFTSGDYVSGRVTLEVTKETEIDSFLIKAKGKASVMWSEHYGQHATTVYHDKETCFKSVQYFVQEKKDSGNDRYTLLTDEAGAYNNVVAPGCHTYPFTFKIPEYNMPPSLKGFHGKVVYFLEAELCRSMRVASKAKAEFNYIPRADLSIPQLMSPQYGQQEKKMSLLTSGSISMEIKTERMGYFLSEGLKVEFKVTNRSSRAVKPKFCLDQKQSYFAMKRRKVHTKQILKEEGDVIEPHTNQNGTKVLSIHPDKCISYVDCRILKVEYRLKVSLDVRFTAGPCIKLPIVILPITTSPEVVSPPDIQLGFKTLTLDSDFYQPGSTA